MVKDLTDSFFAFNWSKEEDQISRLSAWNKLLALLKKAPATLATNKEGSDKDQTQGNSTSYEKNGKNGFEH